MCLSLVDSDTLGTMGNVKVIVTYLPDSCGLIARSAREDPIPLCVLNSFRHEIGHALQWAGERFEIIFTQIPRKFSFT